MIQKRKFPYKSDFELKKNTTRQILNWKKYNASDLKKKFSSCQILDEKLYNVSDFKLKIIHLFQS